MKTTDQNLLENVYVSMLVESYFRYKDGQPIKIGDKVRYIKDKENEYKIVGGSMKTDKVQLERIEEIPANQTPHWINVRMTQIEKLSQDPQQLKKKG